MHSVDDTGSIPSSWNSAPDCLRVARELMQTRVRVYGAMPDINISKLDIRAWVTAGSKRASYSEWLLTYAYAVLPELRPAFRQTTLYNHHVPWVRDRYEI